MRSIAEERPRCPDRIVLELARAERRVLVTNDKDFAVLTFLRRATATGIVLLRMPRLSSAAKGERVSSVLDKLGERVLHVLTVVGPGRARFRRLPAAPGDRS